MLLTSQHEKKLFSCVTLKYRIGKKTVVELDIKDAYCKKSDFKKTQPSVQFYSTKKYFIFYI